MNDPNKPSWQPDEAEIHAYVDGRLDETTRARMETWLDSHPDRADEIRGWQRDAQQLRAAFGDLPASASQGSLEPGTIRMRHRHRVRSRMALAAGLLLALGVGGFGGWQARDMSTTGASASAPMADAMQAYRMFATERQARLDVVQRHDGDLQSWLDRHFHHAARLPDLDASGFAPVGGRLVATDSGPAAMVLYRNPRGDAISFYIRSPAPHTEPLPHGQRREGRIAATYWSGNGYNYALVGHTDSMDMRVMHEAARSIGLLNQTPTSG